MLFIKYGFPKRTGTLQKNLHKIISTQVLDSSLPVIINIIKQTDFAPGLLISGLSFDPATLRLFHGPN